MNYKRMTAHCKRAKRVIIITDADGVKFISDGVMTARLADNTRLTPEAVVESMDAAPDEIVTTELQEYTALTNTNNSERIEMINIGIIYQGKDYWLFSTTKGMLLVPAKRLAVFANDRISEYHLEITDEETVLALKGDNGIIGRIAAPQVNTNEISYLLNLASKAATEADEHGFQSASAQLELH